jgi:hypothetical protein
MTNVGMLNAMDAPRNYDQLTVKETLRKWPQALTIFTERKTKCPGCYMQRFCTLKYVAETYNFSLLELVWELEEGAQSNIITKGVPYEKNVDSV